MNTNSRLAPLFFLAGVVGLFETAPAQAQRVDPPATEAEAVRMLASDDYRERDEAMFWVLDKASAREPIGAELRTALLRATMNPNWGDGRPEIDPALNSDGWGELWSLYREAVVKMRDPATIPFLLAEGVGPYALADMGRPALVAMIEALEDPEADLGRAVDVALAGLTLMIHDGLPTEEERARIVAATRYRLETGGLPLSAVTSAFGLAVTLGMSELLAVIERAANNRAAAAALEQGEELADRVQRRAREALQPGYVPVVIRWLHRHR